MVMELAISLSCAGWKTVILDGDLRKGNNYKRLNADNKKDWQIMSGEILEKKI